MLALMLLTDSRRRARTLPDGMLVPLAEQDRRLWDSVQIAEGLELLSAVLGVGRPGPYQLQAAIAAVHAEAPSADQTDWPQILALYTVLEAVAPSPVVALNRAVAVAMVEGPRAALQLLDGLEDELKDWHRLDAVRGHLLEMSRDLVGARECLLAAARKTNSLQERRYLQVKAANLAQLST
ncbi:DUF6596 domain-containing protein [Arthrobacter sp. B2a2-09]|uniref:DUF6596 domain-containing protein n=1 Tax=Arthrobacter sp. B2a2-09 TaxID=2952822 RepID=UPI002FD5EF5B